MVKRENRIDLGLGATYPRLGPTKFKLVLLRIKVQPSTSWGSAGYGPRSILGRISGRATYKG